MTGTETIHTEPDTGKVVAQASPEGVEQIDNLVRFFRRAALA